MSKMNDVLKMLTRWGRKLLYVMHSLTSNVFFEKRVKVRSMFPLFYSVEHHVTLLCAN